MEEVRVRFAPSPTGYLHIGGARTALYNWLYAKKHDGVFILRIEDTDETRSTEEAIGAIEDSLKWLGLDWDEGPGIGGESGPYRQSQRGGRYSLALRELLRTDRAYHCYCLPDELKDQRARQRSEGRPPRYDRTCLDLSDEQIRSFTEVGRQPTVRFLTTDSGKTVIKDLVRGDVSFDNSTFGDFILARSDGTPTYNLAVVVDDHEMGV
ncbi:MAG: glutamate--tRNA ligase, partial [Terriglobia bacterium]